MARRHEEGGGCARYTVKWVIVANLAGIVRTGWGSNVNNKTLLTFPDGAVYVWYFFFFFYAGICRVPGVYDITCIQHVVFMPGTHAHV